ncbi:MAG: hypothetical protein EXR83_01225 [Gammaproteobacteria bacterium]|nr:hypothetical protein [Gammaproteobacteria bacterium]
MGDICKCTGLSLVLAVLSAPVAGSDIKCWKNSDGVRECGNIVPPEYAQTEHVEKSDTGMTLRTQTPAKTPEQVAAERLAKETQMKTDAAASAADKQRLAADQVLLDTFSTEEDIQLALSGQLSNIESQIKVSTSQAVKLNKALDQLIAQAADHERSGRPIPEDIPQRIATLREQIVNEQAFVTAKRTEQAMIKEKFAIAASRFRELRADQ